MFRFEPADPDDPRIAELVATHAQRALAAARCRKGHALDAGGLREPAIQLFALSADDGPVAIGALRRLSAEEAELKSMFVVDARRGHGIGRVLLDRLIETARRQGVRRLLLETGASDYFDAARALYAGAGFVACEAFADLPPHPDSRFMRLDLPS